MNEIVEMTKSSYSSCQRNLAIIASCTEKAETIFTKLKATQEYYARLAQSHKKTLKETQEICEKQHSDEEIIAIDNHLRGVLEAVQKNTDEAQLSIRALDDILSQILNNVNIDFTKLTKFPEVNDE